jgi:putative endopeptidase
MVPSSSGIDDVEGKCPCCNNPWAKATGELFASLCGACATTTAESTRGLSRLNMKLDLDPADNFYQYANGGWIDKNPIPSGYSSWNTFTTLRVQSQEQCKELLEDLQKRIDGDHDRSDGVVLTENERKLACFFRAAMDEASIESIGISPLKPVMELVDEITASHGTETFPKLLGQLPASYGVYPFFSTGPSPDAKNSEHSLCSLSQGGLGLPDRDYYFDEDKADKRVAYKKHIANILAQYDSSLSQVDATAIAEKVFALETELAKDHMTRIENRDPHATYNKMSIDQLTSAAGAVFDFASYLTSSTGKTAVELGEINVRNVVALGKAASTAVSSDTGTLAWYLKWRVLSSFAPYLTKAFVEENFDFFERVMVGTQEMLPRWKRAMAFTESALGEALGELYCARFFDEDCKMLANSIVESVRQALEERLNEVDWMKAESTREQALKKMSRFKVKIGYPNKWIDYTTLAISETDTFFEMVAKARAFAHARESKEMNAPTDREKWFMTPQTVNAYYHPSLNEIVFPAAILQHPFFDKTADDAVNYGAMGAVIGHEMTHAFDDKGRKYNCEGVLEDWWTASDAAEYEKRVAVMVEQANAFEVHGKSVQGKLTSGENIADLGGLRLALRALTAQSSYQQGTPIDGFTPLQRFFLAWAQNWRQNITKERSLQLLTLDPHGPNEMRCNGPLSNMPEFHEAFDVGGGGKAMFKPKEARVDIW